MKKYLTILILTALIAVCVYPLIKPVYARTVGIVSDKLGAFTGPESGDDQDDNVKASLDLLHSLLSPGLARGTGSVFYVDSGASGGDTGLNWTDAALTIDAGIGLCTADRGDFVLVAAGHAETFDAANEADLDLAGVYAWSLGSGNSRATLSYTASGEFVLGSTGDNCTIRNFRFIATADSVLKAIDVEIGCVGWSIIDCEFSAETTTTDEFDDVIIVGAGCDNGLIQNNRFLGDPGSNSEPQTCINFVDSDYLQIIGNECYGDRAVACIENETTASNHILIDDNILFNGIIGGDAGLNTQPGIELVATTTGVIRNNTVICNVAEPHLAIVAADCYLSNNIYNETESDSAGQIIGTRAGETYATSKAMAAGEVRSGTPNLWDVDGGPIIITNFYGLVTTSIGTTTTTIEIALDADGGWTDYDFSTAVAITTDSAGFKYAFESNVVGGTESVLTPCEGADGGATSLFESWLCGEGMIECMASTNDNDGAITWYMTYIPLADGVTVTAQ